MSIGWAIAYVDEAGRLVDPRDRYVVLAAVVTSSVRELKRIIRKASRKQEKVQFKRRDGREVKWSNAWDSLKRRVLSEVGRRDVQIFWLLVDKEGKAIPDTPENYGLMVSELLQECLVYCPDLEVTLDVHFGSPTQREWLNEVLMERLTLVKKPVQLDSQIDAVIQVADFVAGAVLSQHTGKGHLVDLFADKVVVGKVVKWRQLAKKKR